MHLFTCRHGRVAHGEVERNVGLRGGLLGYESSCRHEGNDGEQGNCREPFHESVARLSEALANDRCFAPFAISELKLRTERWWALCAPASL